MFIGRERELEALSKLYVSDKFEFVVIYGRRRVGKALAAERAQHADANLALGNGFLHGNPPFSMC